MVDADLAHGVVDRVDHVLDRGAGLFVEDGVQRAGVLAELLLGPDGDDRVTRHQGVGQAVQRLQVEALAQGIELVQGALAQGLEVGREAHHLHHAAAVLDRLQFVVAEVARNVHQRTRCGVGSDHRRAAQAGNVFQGQGGHLRHIDDHAKVVEPAYCLLAQRRQATEGIGGVVEERQRARGVGPGVVAHVAEAEHAHAAGGPGVQGIEVVAQRVGIEHAEEDRELAFAMQAAEVGGGVGDGDLVGVVANHAGEDLVAHLLLLARFVDEGGGRAMGGVRAIPDFRPAEDRQRSAREATAAGLDQVELAAAILVGLLAFGAEVQRHGDVAVEGDDALLEFFGMFHHLTRVAGRQVDEEVPGRGARKREDQRQGSEVGGLAQACRVHCHPVGCRVDAVAAAAITGLACHGGTRATAGNLATCCR